MTDCQHDYDNPKRLGRANYICRLCGGNISLDLVLIDQLEDEWEQTEPKKEKE